MSPLLDRARFVRPMFLLLIGALFGAVIVGPVAASISGPSSPTSNVLATTTYTRSASCAGLDFYPTDSATHYANLGTLRTRVDGDGTGVFRCDPGLPNKSVVKKVQWTLADPNFYETVGPCALVRSGLTVATAASYQQMASDPGSIGTGSPGIFRVTDSTIDFAVIDNTNFGYWLECGISEPTGTPSGIYGATVTYTISSVNG